MAASIAGKTSSPVRNHWQAVWVVTDDMPDTLFCGGNNGNAGKRPGMATALHNNCCRLNGAAVQAGRTGGFPDDCSLSPGSYAQVEPAALQTCNLRESTPQRGDVLLLAATMMLGAG